MSWPVCTARRLREAADRFIPLNSDVLLPAPTAPMATVPAPPQAADPADAAA